MITRACPVCGLIDGESVFAEVDFDAARLDEFSFASRKLPEYMHYRLICCPHCDLLYANPIPKQGFLKMAYREASFDSSEESLYASQTYGRLLQTILSRLPDRVGALDIGAGDGSFLKQLISHGFTKVMGIEPSKAPIEAADRDIRPLIRNDYFRAQDFEKKSYSLVTCFQTFEHLYDPLEMCLTMYRLLKEGGAALFICHNYRSFSAKLLGMKSPIFDIEHLQLFSIKSAQFMMGQSGFSDVQVDTIVNSYPIHYWAKLFPLSKNIKVPLISVLKKLKIGFIPMSLPAGNIALLGFKREAGANQHKPRFSK